MKDKDWRKKARKAIQEERESLNEFRKTYKPPPTREEMIEFINRNEIIVFNRNLETISDYDLQDICMEIAWMDTRNQ